jgi:hypothetical protein
MRRSHSHRGSAVERAVDRTAQNIPLPLGTFAPAHRPARRRTRHAPDVRRIAAGAGVLAFITGITLIGWPEPAGVYLAGGSVHVGAMTLTDAGPSPSARIRVYQGSATYVLLERGDGSAEASAAWFVDHRTWGGRCALRSNASRLVEECWFETAQGSVTSLDVLDPADGLGWQRTYSDGAHVVINVPPGGAVVPVAFPIGR